MADEIDPVPLILTIFLIILLFSCIGWRYRCRKPRGRYMREHFVIDVDSKGELCTAGSKDPECGIRDVFETEGTTGFPECDSLKKDPSFPCGTYTRYTTCFDSAGNPLPPSSCSATSKPTLTCTKPCDFSNWVVTRGPCEGGRCGREGYQIVSATCPTGKICDPANKPKTGRVKCKMDPCQWSAEYGKCLTSDGKQCGVTAGRGAGNQSVTLKCDGGTNFSLCDPSKRPPTTPKPCDIPACFWNVGKWANNDPDIKCSNVNGVCQADGGLFCRKNGGVVQKGLCSGPASRVCCVP